MINYIIKTNKGYYAGIEYGEYYDMGKQAVDGWHTYTDYKFEKMKWTDDKDQAKELWRNTISTFFNKLDELLDKGLENINEIEVIIIE